MRDVEKRVKSGEEIKIVAGPDDICAPLICSVHWHCERVSVSRRDENALNLLPWDMGEIFVLTEETRSAMKSNYRAKHYQVACMGCSWEKLCANL